MSNHQSRALKALSTSSNNIVIAEAKGTQKKKTLAARRSLHFLVSGFWNAASWAGLPLILEIPIYSLQMDPLQQFQPYLTVELVSHKPHNTNKTQATIINWLISVAFFLLFQYILPHTHTNPSATDHFKTDDKRKKNRSQRQNRLVVCNSRRLSKNALVLINVAGAYPPTITTTGMLKEGSETRMTRQNLRKHGLLKKRSVMKQLLDLEKTMKRRHVFFPRALLMLSALAFFSASFAANRTRNSVTNFKPSS